MAARPVRRRRSAEAPDPLPVIQLAALKREFGESPGAPSGAADRAAPPPEPANESTVRDAEFADLTPPARAGWRPGRVTRVSLMVALALAAAAWPALLAASSRVGVAATLTPVDRTQWTVPLAAAAATSIERQHAAYGWAPGAPVWSPLAHLAGKPAWQSAFAQALGELTALAGIQAGGDFEPDADLAAAGRLLNASSTPAQLRAAGEALVNFDRRVRRGAADAGLTPADAAERLRLVGDWAALSQADLARPLGAVGGWPVDRDANVAVHAAAARGAAAWIAIETLDWPEAPSALSAREAALSAWRRVAEFRPLVVANGDPDGLAPGNHAAALGFLVDRAAAATADYLELVELAPAGAAAPAVPPVADAGAEAQDAPAVPG
jgi:hypothetical protein